MSDRPRSRSRSFDRDGPQDDAPSGGAPNGGGAPEEDPVKLYLGNLYYNTDEQRLRDEFSSFGSITDVYLPTDRDSGRVRGFGFVTFATRAEATKAIDAMDGQELDGRTIRVNESRPRGEGGRGGPGGGGGFNASGAPDVKLFCGNLSFDTDTDKLRSLFEKFGEVQDCYMPTDRDSGKPRGFAFVTMAAKDAEVAMNKMDGEDVDGRNIRVNEAMAKRDSGGYGGGRGGDRGGYGGDRGGYGGDRGGYGGDRGGYGGDRGGYGGDRGGYGGDRGGGYGGDRYSDRGGGYGGDRGGGYGGRGGDRW